MLATETMTYALIVIVITAYGAVSTQHVAQFSNYHDCAAFAVAWTSGLGSPDETVRWTCEIEEKP
jgi:hypothetical protein